MKVRMKTRPAFRKALLLTMFLLFPVTLYYFSPALFLEGASSGVATGSLFVFALLFFSSLLLGRLFCGWACPAGGLQECVASFRSRKVRGKRIGWIKYLIWVPWIVFFVYLLLQAGGLRRIDFFYRTHGGVSVADLKGLIIYFAVVFVFFVLAAAVGSRAGCHTICWMAPFMVIGRKVGNLLSLPGLRLQAEPETCIKCGRCTQACPMSIAVTDRVQNDELETGDCILCGSCVDVCPEGAIRYAFAAAPAVHGGPRHE